MILFNDYYRLPEALGGGIHVGGPIGGDDCISVAVPMVGFVRIPVDALTLVTLNPPNLPWIGKDFHGGKVRIQLNGTVISFGAAGSWVDLSHEQAEQGVLAVLRAVRQARKTR